MPGLPGITLISLVPRPRSGEWQSLVTWKRQLHLPETVARAGPGQEAVDKWATQSDRNDCLCLPGIYEVPPVMFKPMSVRCNSASEEKGPFLLVVQGYFLLSLTEAEGRRIWVLDFFLVFLSPVSQAWSLLAGSQALMWQHPPTVGVRGCILLLKSDNELPRTAE